MILKKKSAPEGTGAQAGNFAFLEHAWVGRVGWMILAFLLPTVVSAQG